MLDALFPDEGESIDLFDNWRLTATVRLPRNEAELRATVMEVATAVVAQTRVRAIMASMYASLLFARLAREAERACPDFNVDAFLQRAALELEEGQSGT